ncbi:MAG: ATP-binding protein [Pseudonocardia sp.]|nr:ATP-binding protein [Pseudonocardia sp.]
MREAYPLVAATTPAVRVLDHPGLPGAGYGHPAEMTDSQYAGRAGGRPLRLCHRADPEELHRIRRRIGRWAEQSGVPEDVTIDLQLAVGEAVANGVEHAYRDAGSSDAATVDVELEVRAGHPDAVVVRVADHGHWRPAPTNPGYRGRGLLMIELLARRVQVLCSPRGTEVCFEIPYPA